MEKVQWPLGTVVVAVIPAYNEESYVGRAVDSLRECRRLGIVHEVVVVSDGSTDMTARVARMHQAEVLELPENRGKAAAFAAGIRHAEKKHLGQDRGSLEHRVRKGSVIVVSLDADVEARPEQVLKLVEPLVRDRKLMMTIGRLKPHPTYLNSDRFSGQRAVRLEALGGLLRANRQWKEVLKTGYGLEMALNRLVRSQKFVDTGFAELRKPGGKGVERLEREIDATAAYFLQREKRAKALREQRAALRQKRPKPRRK
jgi:glycosyltransferase involved in cell wall biosynthesis